MPKSSKGFVAIDLDGTTLVEKIDKNFTYGVKNSQSNIRQTLIEYCRAAQNAGYDIIILTARPELVEYALGRLKLGTKPTQGIVDHLSAHGIMVKEIVRAPAGLKGKKMQEVLVNYHHEGHTNALGMLFEDQLKQVNDVRNQNNPNLKAYDINSKKDLEEYINTVPLQHNKKNPFHPEQIVIQVLEQNQDLRLLKDCLDKLDTTSYSQQIELIQSVIDDLCIRFYEAQYREYKPEINWVAKITKNVRLIMEKLNTKEVFTYHEIEKINREIFGKANLQKVKPNSNCELLVKNMLIDFGKFAVINNLRAQCLGFKVQLSKDSNSEYGPKTLEQTHLEIVDQLIENLKNPNPNRALDQFTQTFTASKEALRLSSGGNAFVEYIRMALAQLPVIGEVFKTENEKLSSTIEKQTFRFYKKSTPNEQDDQNFLAEDNNTTP
jgi:hypothetical protein